MLVVMCIMHTGLYAQVVSIDYILSQEAENVQKRSIPKENTVALSTEFGEFKIIEQQILDTLNEDRIEKIDLVYTLYFQSETFVQPDLNRKRLKYLKSQKPYIFENSLIEWNIVCQTGAKTSEVAKNYFHGFIIHFRPDSLSVKELTTKEEIEVMDEILSECVVEAGDTIRDISSVLSKGDMDLSPIVLIDSIIRIPKGRYKGKFLEVDPSTIKNKRYFDYGVNRKKLHYSRSFTDTVVMQTAYSKIKRLKVEDTYIPRSKSKARKGITYERKSIWGRKQKTEKLLIKDTIFIRIDSAFVLLASEFPVSGKDCHDHITENYFRDPVVTQTFSEMEDLQNTIIVEDVTGSMYPYLTQTFLWRRAAMDSEDLSKFVYFNDGDRKANHEKIIGETGGIYFVNSSSIDKVESTAKLAMSAGGGGDAPENNLEALIYARKICPDCRPVMIADNWAPIKDLSLLRKIDRPVDVILCGVWRGRIQADYLTLVNAVGGTIYTMEGVLSDISELEEGDIIEMGGQRFKLIGGRFVLTR